MSHFVFYREHSKAMSHRRLFFYLFVSDALLRLYLKKPFPSEKECLIRREFRP